MSPRTWVERPRHQQLPLVLQSLHQPFSLTLVNCPAPALLLLFFNLLGICRFLFIGPGQFCNASTFLNLSLFYWKTWLDLKWAGWLPPGDGTGCEGRSNTGRAGWVVDFDDLLSAFLFGCCRDVSSLAFSFFSSFLDEDMTLMKRSDVDDDGYVMSYSCNE